MKNNILGLMAIFVFFRPAWSQTLALAQVKAQIVRQIINRELKDKAIVRDCKVDMKYWNMPLLQPYILDSAAFHDSAYINAKQDTLFEKCLRDDLAKHLKCKYNIGGNPSISKHLRGLNYPKITQEWIEIFTPLDGWDALLLFYQSTVIDKDTITLYLPVVSYSSRKTRYHLYEVAVIRTFKHQKELFSAKIQTAISLKTPIYTRYR